MTFIAFQNAVDNLVCEWVKRCSAGQDEPCLPRGELKAIYDSVREQAVKDCADWQEQKDKAMELIHRSYTKQK